jgi:hypothetical protein
MLPKVQTQLRMDPHMKKRVNEYMKKFYKEHNVEIGFSKAVHALLANSLDREGIQ